MSESKINRMNGKSAVSKMPTGQESPPSHTIRTYRFLVVAACIVVATVCLIAFRHLFPPTSAWPQGWLNSFDVSIVRYVNPIANRWLWLPVVAHGSLDHPLLRGGPIVLLFWAGFFQRTGGADEILERRRKIAAIVPLALFGIVLARLMADLLPFRERPLRTVALHFQMPPVLKLSVLYGWSSFPSDHAVLFVALSVGLLMASRLLGSLALLYTFVVFLFLRVYMGLHWPTDLLVGATIGAALASIVNVKAYRDFIWRMVTKCWQRWPATSAAFMFLLSFEIMDVFKSFLAIAKLLLKHLL